MCRPSAAPSRALVVVKSGRSYLAKIPHRPSFFKARQLAVALQRIDGSAATEETMVSIFLSTQTGVEKYRCQINAFRVRLKSCIAVGITTLRVSL